MPRFCSYRSSLARLHHTTRCSGLLLLGSFPLLATLPVHAQNAPASSVAQAPISHTFVYVADKKLNSVAVAGTFNNWSKNANPMQVDADGLTWRLTLPFGYGKHLYKFVLDDDNWIPDPKAASNETDGSGYVNSVLALLPPDYGIPANPNDGITASSALLHQARTPYVNYDRGKLAVSLRVRPNDVRSVALRTATGRVPMKLVKSGDLYATYQGQIAWDRKRDLAYSFELQDGTRTEQFGTNGLSAKGQPFRIIAKEFKPFIVPSWVERTVFYQIFPDRFANGDKSNDPKNVAAWNSKPEGSSYFGGDAKGVQQHLPYLKSLGISGVYFNPVFESPVSHRYETTDYKKIDPIFGTNAEFAALTKAMHTQGIRTVLDMVYNHSATNFGPFMDIREKGEASKYDDWYFIKSYPVKVGNPPNYQAWYNYPSMPKLNVLNPPTRDYLLDVVNYWNKEIPLAGLRLDAANEVDMRFWRALRDRSKKLDPQMWIVGEEWNDATAWLQGDQWDSVMNYPFLFANVDFFADGKTSASQFTNRLMEVYGWYAPQVSRNMMNLLSSHDRPRFLTLCKNDERLAKLAAAVQFTWVGAPSVYYGDEIGMEGGADPDNRRGMEWNKATDANPMLRYYKRLVQIRNSSLVLQSGDPAVLMTDDARKSFAYSRTLNGEMAIVAINRSDAPQTLALSLPKGTKNSSRRFKDAFTGKAYAQNANAKLTVQLAPLSSAILLPSAPATR